VKSAISGLVLLTSIDHRNEFEEFELIFDSRQNVWRAQKQAIWADYSIVFHGRSSISLQYPSCEGFFVDILQVDRPDKIMLIQALKTYSKEGASLQQLKELMVAISGLSPTEKELKPLGTCSLFPVTLVTGISIGRKTVDRRADFAIIDREEYGELFKSRVDTLDFPLEDVRRCHNFFMALGLHEKYISNIIEEKTTVDDGNLSMELTRAFTRKAYAIFRYVDGWPSFRVFFLC